MTSSNGAVRDALTRREFLGAATALAGVACAARAPAGARTPARDAADRGGSVELGFSTLGCPNWSWDEVLSFAAAHGFATLELRGLLADMDLTRRPEFATDRLDSTRRQLAERRLRVSCLGASAGMHEMEPAKRAAAMAEARRFVDLAAVLRAPYVRVFGDRYVAGVPRDEMLAHIARGLRELGDHAHRRGVTVLVESHGDFTDSASLRELIERASSPAVALLWDAHHTFVAGKEQPEQTVRELGRWIRHTHLKDSVPAGADRRYVLTGTGEVPVQRQVQALVASGYTGAFSFEWEKRWHPEIEEPEIAIAHYARVMREYVRDARR